MLTVATVPPGTSWSHYYEQFSHGYGGQPIMVAGYAVSHQPLPVQYRTVGEKGKISVPYSYGDSSQRCHACIHRDVDGVVSSRDFIVDQGGILLPSPSDWVGRYLVASPGYYLYDWTTPTPTSGALNASLYHRTTQGVVFVWAQAVSYSSASKTETTSTRLQWRTLTDKNGKWNRRAGSSSVTVRIRNRHDLETDLRGSMEVLASQHWPGRQGSVNAADYRTITFQSFSPSDAELRRMHHTLMEHVSAPALPEAEEKKLYAQCVEGQNCFTSNGIAYAQDIGKVGDSIRALLALVENPTSPRAWASAWLSARFSDRLTYQDSKELFAAIRSQLERLMVGLSYRDTRSRASLSYAPQYSHFVENYQITGNARLRCSNESYSALMTTVKKLMEWDVWPTLENSWDMIPLSFVVDWFTNLSTILTNIDTLVYEQYLRVHFYERSDKVWITFRRDFLEEVFGTSLGANCSVRGRFYHRYRAMRPQLGILDGWSPSLPAPKNYVDSAALLIQMRF